MIHHLSMSARDPRHVAEVLAELISGSATPFPPNPGSWFVHQDDENGTGVEVFPAGTALRPDEGLAFAAPERGEPDFGPTHFAISVETSGDTIAEIARREGWCCNLCARGGETGFHVMEVWVDNTFMIEFLPPAFAAEYVALHHAWRRSRAQAALENEGSVKATMSAT